MGEPKLEEQETEKLEVSEARKIELKLVILYGGGFDLEIYIQLNNSDKLVKLSPKNEDKIDTLKRFASKGLKHVYLKPNDYEVFVKHVKVELAQIKASDELSEDEMAEKLSGGRAVLSSLFKNGCVDDGAKEIVKNMAVASMQMMKHTKIEKAFNKFKKNCTQEYFRALITAHVACMTLDGFSWSNPQMKEKVSIASILCDITLDQEDFVEKKEKKNCSPALSDKVRNHPEDSVKLLTTNKFFSGAEILEIIKFHHESPDGTGYPSGMRFGGMKILPAIFIVANHFVEDLLSEEENVFDDLEKAKERIEIALDKCLSLYTKGNFKKAAESMVAALRAG